MLLKSNLDVQQTGLCDWFVEKKLSLVVALGVTKFVRIILEFGYSFVLQLEYNLDVQQIGLWFVEQKIQLDCCFRCDQICDNL